MDVGEEVKLLTELGYHERKTEAENQVYLGSTPHACMKKVLVFGLVDGQDPDAVIQLVCSTAQEISGASLDEKQGG